MIEKWLKLLKQKWIWIYFLQVFFFAFAISAMLVLFLIPVFGVKPWVLISCFLVVFALLAFAFPFWNVQYPDLLRYLNRNFSELEESAELLLRRDEELRGIEKLQKEKIIRALPTFNRLKEPRRKVKWALAALLIGTLFCILIIRLAPFEKKDTQDFSSLNTGQQPIESIPLKVSSVIINIEPPLYTQTGKRTQKQLSLIVETDALVKWEIKTTKAIKSLSFIFNGMEVLPLNRLDKKGFRWGLTKPIHSSGFYQIDLEGELSDFYPLECIPDLPPVLTIAHPKQHSTIDFGAAQKLQLNVTITDDYGLKSALISATLATGKGEGVSFSERQINFQTPINNQRALNLKEIIDLRALGMKPGDELYYFVKALDHRGQSSQSEVYMVSLVDTAELMSMGSMTSGVDLVPEYFRSQRQLIIDTERLIKERDTLSRQLYENRSNALGMDQKLLRLRYGKFLGEEFETEIGGDHDHDEEEPEASFGGVEALMDSYTHKHDIAEDATFFEPEMKAQLKEVLTEMWSAELQLRVNKPQSALPFEYKALRLLKDLQHQSRVYVAKTTTKAANLKEEKRLTGELEGVNESIQINRVLVDSKREKSLKSLLELLEKGKERYPYNAEDKALWKEAEGYLMEAARDNPTSFLPALKGMKNLPSKYNNEDINLVQKVVRKILIQEKVKPQGQGMRKKSHLNELYFKGLLKQN